MVANLPKSLESLPETLQSVFNLPLLLVCTETEQAPETLSPAEQQIFTPLAETPRRPSWLRGRAALKELLERLELSPDTAALRFPHPFLSLTHSGRYAMALGCDARFQTVGVGLDYEAHRSPSEKSTRFFLGSAEKVWLESLPEAQQPDARLRLWTVKEALFKADPENAEKRYLDYALSDPSVIQGQAVSQDERRLTFQYYSVAALEGWISVALLSQAPKKNAAGGSAVC